MNAEEMATVTSIVRALRTDKGITTVVVEHNVDEVLGMCDHARL